MPPSRQKDLDKVIPDYILHAGMRLMPADISSSLEFFP